MNGDFEYRQRQIEQEKEKHRAQIGKSSTVETWHIEQGEANLGHAPSGEGTDAAPPEPGLLGRLLRSLRRKPSK
ncbi:MAG: hypothetical protein SGI73_16335 [Chloroflexota bacterium]|nr:hypothetical protein [Chloroflexota bacterium]